MHAANICIALSLALGCAGATAISIADDDAADRKPNPVGVPAGTPLTAYAGPMTITRDGTVIDGKIITGSLRVVASDVVIRNCRIMSDAWWGVDADGARNITIQDSTIIGPGYSAENNSAILGSGTFLRNDISKVTNGITLQGGASTVRGNYIHDLESAGSDPHYDGIEVFGGQNGVLIEGNTIVSRDTSDILISDLYGPVSNVTVTGNYLGGTPGYNVYVSGSRGGATGVSITNNTLVKGWWGYYSIDGSSPLISGNTNLVAKEAPGDDGEGATNGEGASAGGVVGSDPAAKSK